MFNLINTLTNVCQFVVIRQLSINHNFTNTCTLQRTPVVLSYANFVKRLHMFLHNISNPGEVLLF